MRVTAVFFLYLLCCLALAALTAVPLLETGLLDEPPRRVMGRLAQLYILLGLWPFLRLLRLDNRAALGFGISRRRFLLEVAVGWVLGVAILSALVWALLALGVRLPDLPAAGLTWFVLEKAIAALIGGLLIGLLEELFFRGALYGAIRRHGSLRVAVVWSAALYALLHFLKPHDLPPGVPFDWAGSRAMFAGVFTGALDLAHLDSLLALFLVGVFLALVRERAGHIAWGVGLHAGWVFVIQLTRRLTDADDGATFAFVTGAYDGVIGLLAAAWIGVLAWGFWGLSGWRRVEALTRKLERPAILGHGAHHLIRRAVGQHGLDLDADGHLGMNKPIQRRDDFFGDAAGVAPDAGGVEKNRAVEALRLRRRRRSLRGRCVDLRRDHRPRWLERQSAGAPAAPACRAGADSRLGAQP